MTCAMPMSGRNRFLYLFGVFFLRKNYNSPYAELSQRLPGFFLLSSSALCQHGNCSYLVSRIFINLDIFFHRQIEFMLWEKSHFSSPNYKIQIWNGKITFVLPKIEYQNKQNYKSASNVFTVTTNLYCYLLNYCIFAPINNRSTKIIRPVSLETGKPGQKASFAHFEYNTNHQLITTA